MEILPKGAGVVNGEVTRRLGGLDTGAVNALADAVTFQRVVHVDAGALELVHVGLVWATTNATHEECGQAGATGRIVAQLLAPLALFNQGESVKTDGLNRAAKHVKGRL